jgi:hypothetical protein
MRRRKTLSLWGLWYVDPAFHSDNRHVEPCPIFISGFPVSETDEFVTIANEAHADGEHRDFTTIPKAVIKDLKEIKRIPVPDWVSQWRERYDKDQ